MSKFKIVISDPKTRKSYQIETEAPQLIGKKIGDSFEGSIIGIPNYKFQITGGSDKDGFPMHPAVKGIGRKKVLLSKPPGFKPRIKGQRKRKTVRGNTISEDIVQINTKIIEYGSANLEDIIKREKNEGR